ncbi:hypothetical protein [Anaerobaca lacustris]|uniref:Gingipain propeptide domain-containing protein n=1 Tax=Anaerobaca lacustris TaxID=3044600 RepID=A0AAW6TT54_9BACT|nr:hypothetical protein [Sedimentisphaerales bacterium M17dextr]
MRTRRTKFATMVLCVVLPIAALADEAPPSTGPVIPDGTVIQAVDGSLVRSDSNDLWLFQFARDVDGVGGALPAGSSLEVLPSSILDSMVADANDRLLPRYRLSAVVTQYRGANYLFPTYYLPLSKLKGADESETTEEPLDNIETVSDGALEIPDEVLERMRTRRQARGPQRREADETPTETGHRARTHVLVDRVGFIEFNEGYPTFVPDGLGRNVSQTRYELLPCNMLEQAERRLAAFPQPIRFNVAGLVTEHQGRKYLLLQRAIRVYHYGNFGG